MEKDKWNAFCKFKSEYKNECMNYLDILGYKYKHMSLVMNETINQYNLSAPRCQNPRSRSKVETDEFLLALRAASISISGELVSSVTQSLRPLSKLSKLSLIF